MSLESEIKSGSLSVATDSYDMSIGELINVYRDGELVVNPEFQRLFRWSIYQRSHFIESLLVGIPIPSIFVFEQPSGKWELIDGLQRVSTVLEFVGILRDTDGKTRTPSTLQATRTLPSLNGMKCANLNPAQQIAIKRARIGLQILKKTSDVKAKYDLFQRLNSHGSIATDQELRNCVLVMMNSYLFKEMRRLASNPKFITIMQPSATAIENQALMDYVSRYFVFSFVEYDKKWDIEEYLNNGIMEIAEDNKAEVNTIVKSFEETLDIIYGVGEPNILKRFKDGKFTGKVGQAGFEAVFLGVSQNRASIKRRQNANAFILRKAKELWKSPEVSEFTKGGVTGTTRIQKTIPFGKEWFER